MISTRLLENGSILEALAHQQIIEIIGNDNYTVTREACLADGILHFQQNLFLGIQIKSSREHKTKKNTFCFVDCEKYENMLLLCRPIIDNLSIGTIVIPGNLVGKSVCLTTGVNSKYSKYLLKDNELASFLKDLFYTLLDSRPIYYKWPNGNVVDISKLEILSNSKKLLIPFNNNRIIEYTYSEWRRNILSSEIIIKYPFIQNTTVDTLINNKRFQDKTARPQQKGFNVILQKNAGMINKKRTYHQEDFDFLSIFIPGKRYIFIIPMKVLVIRGYVASYQQKGKRSLLVYLPNYDRNLKTKYADLWSLQYFLDTQQTDFEKKFLYILNQ